MSDEPARYPEENRFRRECANTIGDEPARTIEPSRGGGSVPSPGGAALRTLVAGDGPLQLEEVLGRGGMGDVWLAEQVAVGRKVAVKTLRPDRTGTASADKLLIEGWVSGTLEHPNVIPVHDIGLDDRGQPVVVFRRVEGSVWSEHIRDEDAVRRRFSAPDLLEWNLKILMQVCRGIHFAHSRGILHRDIKPDNVMLGDYGEVYLVDWGIAASLQDDAGSRIPVASSTQMAGTPLYMAPEMLGRGDVPLSPRSDVYLLGATLYEIICGHPPHKCGKYRAIIDSVVRSRPSFSDDAPSDLVRVCRRAMAPDPAARHDSAEAFRIDVQRFLDRRGADRLATEAERRLDVLSREVETRPDDDSGHRMRLYNLLAECRFGFREALVACPDLEAARAGWTRAVELTAGYELTCGDPRAAANLIAELDPPPPALRRRVEDAVAERAENERRLAAVARDHDRRVGQSNRRIAIALLGTSWTAAPLMPALGLLPPVQSYAQLLAVPILFAVITASVWIGARNTIRQTRFNRAVMGTIAVGVVVQGSMVAGAWASSVPLVAAELMHPLVWGALSGVAAVTFEPRMMPAALAFLAAFGAAVAFPSHRYLILAMSTAAFTINVPFMWPRPGEQNSTPPPSST